MGVQLHRSVLYVALFSKKSQATVLRYGGNKFVTGWSGARFS